MTTNSSPPSARAWFGEPMVWLVVGLPAIVVGAAIATLVIAIRSGGADAWPTQVRRTAQIQVEDLAADRAAIAMGLKGVLSINADTGAVRIALENLPASTMQVRLDLIHPARADGDVQLMLVRSGEVFLGRLDVAEMQVWSVQVSAPDGAWRIAGRFEPGLGEVPLLPALSDGS